MAFDAQQIFPIDFNKSAAVGVDLPFNAPSVFRSNFTTKQAIKNNLINYFLTNTGERFMNPTFGGGLREFLFEQITQGNIDSLEEDIQQSLDIYFSNIIIEDLSLTSDSEKHTVNISLKYSVANTNINDNIDIEFNS